MRPANQKETPDLSGFVLKPMSDIDQTRAGRSELLGRTNELANDFLTGVVDRTVARPVEFDKLLAEMRAEGQPIDGDDPTNNRTSCESCRPHVVALRDRDILVLWWAVHCRSGGG
jgi:hypothetical protein